MATLRCGAPAETKQYNIFFSKMILLKLGHKSFVISLMTEFVFKFDEFLVDNILRHFAADGYWRCCCKGLKQVVCKRSNIECECDH